MQQQLLTLVQPISMPCAGAAISPEALELLLDADGASELDADWFDRVSRDLHNAEEAGEHEMLHLRTTTQSVS